MRSRPPPREAAEGGVEFLGIGPLELLLIVVVALIVFGPHRLPELMVQVARFIREFRSYASTLTRDLNEVMREFERERAVVDAEWREVGEGLAGASKDVREGVASLEDESRRLEAEIASDGAPAAAPDRGPAS
jgi:sec-independent protein translocase protein TatB